MTDPADDITPEEIAEAEARAAKHTKEGLDRACALLSWNGVVQEVLNLASTQTRLLAALRRRDARIEELSVSHDKFYRAYDAANAKLARAVALLNRSRGGTTTDDDAITAFLAEIEAEHGK